MADIPQILSLDAPESHSTPAGQALVFTVETTEGARRMLCAAADLPQIIAFFVGCSNFLVDETPKGVDQVSVPKNYHPVPARGIGFATTEQPDQAAIVIRLAGFDLTFSVGTAELASMSAQIAQVARTLSASARKPH